LVAAFNLGVYGPYAPTVTRKLSGVFVEFSCTTSVNSSDRNNIVLVNQAAAGYPSQYAR
jgi:hypothetical protein